MKRTTIFILMVFTTVICSAAVAVDWYSETIGSQTLGSVNITDKNVTIKASGSDIGNLADEMHFLYAPARGDVDLIVRVTALEETHSWAKAGLMIRATKIGGSQNAYLCVTESHGICWQWREENDGKTKKDIDSPEYIFPNAWIKLVKRGKQCTAFSSRDGKNWEQVGETQEINFPETYLVGLAVTSHSDGAWTTANFDNLNPMPSLKK